MAGYDSTAEELIAATAEAREVIREMHAATKDLKQAITEARRVGAQVRDDASAGFHGDITKISREWAEWVKAQTEEGKKALADEIDALRSLVIRSVDENTQMMGDTARLVVKELMERRGNPSELAHWALDALQQAEKMLSAPPRCYDPLYRPGAEHAPG